MLVVVNYCFFFFFFKLWMINLIEMSEVTKLLWQRTSNVVCVMTHDVVVRVGCNQCKCIINIISNYKIVNKANLISCASPTQDHCVGFCSSLRKKLFTRLPSSSMPKCNSKTYCLCFSNKWELIPFGPFDVCLKFDLNFYCICCSTSLLLVGPISSTK